MATSPSDDDDRDGGGARLERRRRLRHEIHGARALPMARDEGEGGGG
uniref:B1168G10.6 protein n=1 Tax=Oryza sativa subsp. japonica TaxID=39947 RepID=Q5H9W4_ORYSJ|nr:B1168G10.6 [Oryza sativa Japonica Group]